MTAFFIQRFIFRIDGHADLLNQMRMKTNIRHAMACLAIFN